VFAPPINHGGNWTIIEIVEAAAQQGKSLCGQVDNRWVKRRRPSNRGFTVC
jgi:hypothetical protein